MNADDQGHVDTERIEADRVILRSPSRVVDIAVPNLKAVLVRRPIASLAPVGEEDVGAKPDRLSFLIFKTEEARSLRGRAR